MMFPVKRLREWFLQERRTFPWRDEPSAYKVWVSEMMLQQTQASVVIPYFERWMQLFPTLADLAKAPLEQVVKAWEGLGYYSRARHLHEGARFIMTHFQGIMPQNREQLSQIKGIGPYTQGALLSFAFHQRAAAVDGNVRRVMARFALESGDVTPLVEQALPDHEPWVVMEALIELGALVCTKRPQCHRCPLNQSCLAYHRDLVHAFPPPKKKVAITELFRVVAIVTHQGKYLLQKGERGKVMGELLEFPYVQIEAREHTPSEAHLSLEQKLGLPLQLLETMPEERHSFTRFRATLFPYRFETHHAGEKYSWYKDLNSVPLSSGHRRIKERLLS